MRLDNASNETRVAIGKTAKPSETLIRLPIQALHPIRRRPSGASCFRPRSLQALQHLFCLQESNQAGRKHSVDAPDLNIDILC